MFVGGVWTTATSATIPTGGTSVLVRTPIVNDVLTEGDEAFTLTATVTAGTTGNTSANGTGTILANDVAPTTNAGSGSGLEDAASIAVSLSGGDTDGSVAFFRITSVPANGALYADAGLTNLDHGSGRRRRGGQRRDGLLRPERQLQRRADLPVRGDRQRRHHRCHSGHGDHHRDAGERCADDHGPRSLQATPRTKRRSSSILR